ncbi:MAG: hypothetical protein ABFE07_28945 [Armatimonadia bacterium]
MGDRLIEGAQSCPHCGHTTRSARYECSCDGCGKVFTDAELRGEAHLVRISEHRDYDAENDPENSYGITHRHFCDFACMFKFLRGVCYQEEVRFAMPYFSVKRLPEFMKAAREGGVSTWEGKPLK